MVGPFQDDSHELTWLLQQEMYLDAALARRQAGATFVEDFLLNYDLLPGELREVAKMTPVFTRS